VRIAATFGISAKPAGAGFHNQIIPRFKEAYKMKLQFDTFARQPALWESAGLQVAYVSSYPPRECGIATFCQDLIMSTQGCAGAGEPLVVAMENAKCPQSYDWPVACTVDEVTLRDYEAAARFINNSPAEMVCLQHEFGIYGGFEERSIYSFLRLLKPPLVTILHTVTPNPGAAQRALTKELAWHSDRLVVMNSLAKDILARDYGVSPLKVELIHHGAPYFPQSRKAATRQELGFDGRRVLSTFGLISRGKGLEYVLEALPAIIAQHPEVLYLMIGKTHPGVVLHERESYRDELNRRIEELGLGEHVAFVNHYLTKAEIIQYLCASDVYVTPYLNPDQITSGTLAYAMAAGNAIVSTPYLYARYLLDQERGLLVDFSDGEAISRAVNRVLGDPTLQQRLEAAAYAYGQGMLWSVVGRQYIDLFQQVLAERKAAGAVVSPASYAYGDFALQQEVRHDSL
jgi:glycosyltransferase involved in cell wall biosynthesis